MLYIHVYLKPDSPYIAISTIFNLVKLSNFLAVESVANNYTLCTNVRCAYTTSKERKNTSCLYYTKKLEQVFRYID